jgi:hypothetical protein
MPERVGYLGGDNQSMGEIADRARRVLGGWPRKDLGWPWQCRCGSTQWIKYRGRFYSPCGIRWPANSRKAIPRTNPVRYQTLREAYESVDGES